MPLYEYECDTCGHRFEVIRKFADPPIDKCPVCGSSVHKLQSAPAFQFKGSGWYVTDYARKDSGKTASSDGASAESGKDKTESGKDKTDSGKDKTDTSAKTDKRDRTTGEEAKKSKDAKKPSTSTAGSKTS